MLTRIGEAKKYTAGTSTEKNIMHNLFNLLKLIFSPERVTSYCFFIMHFLFAFSVILSLSYLDCVLKSEFDLWITDASVS